MSKMRKLFILTTLMLLLISIVGVTYAETKTTTEIVMGISATYDGHTISNDTDRPHYTLEPGKTIGITASPTKMHESLKLYVIWAGDIRLVATGTKTGSYTVPSAEPGKSIKVQVQATIDNDPESYVGRSNNVVFYLDMPEEEEETEIDVNLYDGSKKLSEGSTTEKEAGSTLTIKAVTNKEFKSLTYKWDNESKVDSTTNNLSIKVPSTFEDGSSHTLLIQASANDGTKSKEKEYTIKLPKAEEETTVDVDLYNGNTKLAEGSTTELEKGSTLIIKAVTNKEFNSIRYVWDKKGAKESKTNDVSITVPSTFEDGSSHSLIIQASATDGKLSKDKEYTITIPKAAEEETTIDVNLYNGNTKLVEGSTTELEKGSTLIIKAVTNKEFNSIRYVWDKVGAKESKTNDVSITVPSTFEDGSSHSLIIQASATDGKLSKDKEYIITIPKAVEEETTIDVNLYNGNTKLVEGSTTELEKGSTLIIKAVTNKEFNSIRYAWDKVGAKESKTNDVSITVPSTFEDGSLHTLLIQASATNGKKSKDKEYTIKIPASQVKPLTGDIEAEIDGKPVSTNQNNPTETKEGEVIVVEFSPTENFGPIVYNWDDGENKNLPASGVIEVPAFEPGTTHKLTIEGTLKDGGKVRRVFYITIPKVDDKGELDIDPWYRENDDSEGLIISLRSKASSDKSNMNFFMLQEEVTYLVDYKNSGKEIKDEVKVELKLPLAFEVVESDGGKVDTSKKTITWTYPDGMAKGYENTKIVVVRYIAFSRKSNKSEMIYPSAIIYKLNKKQDVSTLIQYIYEDEDTVFDELHRPYMYGDADKPTFRPDDGISRAEGALVLLRIFGVDYKNVKNITTRYSDIEDTYLEAQKAITKATELKIIDGYTDGTYKPNKKMTRAEFMKIIAAYIEESAEEEGLNVKSENAVVLYKNSQNKNHWAVPYVTLLVRLNMTSVSSKEKDLRIDDDITRAEVAQLCNYFLFRAPVKMTSKINIEFSDVSRSHKLIGDIMEATRKEHEYRVTDDGKEEIIK